MSFGQFFSLDALWVFICIFFFFNDTATTEIYTLSLHDALPISEVVTALAPEIHEQPFLPFSAPWFGDEEKSEIRSEEHTSELQSLTNIVCRLLLEKKKKKTYYLKLYARDLDPVDVHSYET